MFEWIFLSLFVDTDQYFLAVDSTWHYPMDKHDYETV
jgi:hypothetical protein